ncbi:hypothetical protein ACNRWW_06965 [Metabacillus sp. HB246100]
MNLPFIGALLLLCSLLIAINHEKFSFLVKPFGFGQSTKLAVFYYGLIGAMFFTSEFLKAAFVSQILLPGFVLVVSLLTIFLVSKKKRDTPFHNYVKNTLK